MTSDKSASPKTLTPSASWDEDGFLDMKGTGCEESENVSCLIWRFVVMTPWNPLGVFWALQRTVYLSV